MDMRFVYRELTTTHFLMCGRQNKRCMKNTNNLSYKHNSILKKSDNLLQKKDVQLKLKPSKLKKLRKRGLIKKPKKRLKLPQLLSKRQHRSLPLNQPSLQKKSLQSSPHLKKVDDMPSQFPKMMKTKLAEKPPKNLPSKVLRKSLALYLMTDLKKDPRVRV